MAILEDRQTGLTVREAEDVFRNVCDRFSTREVSFVKVGA
jgi:hypothetical protein